MAFENLCLYCFEDMEGQTICPHCGRNSNASVPMLQMLPGSRIYHRRFLIGRALGQDKAGIVYAAFDTKKENRLRVREYFPRDAAKRMKDGTVVPAKGKECEFEAGRQRLQHIIENEEDPRKRHYYFEENGTAYVVQRKANAQSYYEESQVDHKKMRGSQFIKRCFSCGRPIINVFESCPFCKEPANEEAFWDSVLASLEATDSSADSKESAIPPQAQNKTSKGWIRCSACGKINNESALFCAFCGEVLLPDRDNCPTEGSETDQLEEINDQQYVDLDGVDDDPENPSGDLLPIDEILKHHFREGNPDENDEASEDLYETLNEDATQESEMSEGSIKDKDTAGYIYQEDDRDRFTPTIRGVLNQQNEMGGSIERSDKAPPLSSKAIGESVYRLSLEAKRFPSRCIKCGRNMAGNRCQCGFSLTNTKVIFLSPPSGNCFQGYNEKI